MWSSQKRERSYISTKCTCNWYSMQNDLKYRCILMNSLSSSLSLSTHPDMRPQPTQVEMKVETDIPDVSSPPPLTLLVFIDVFFVHVTSPYKIMHMYIY